MGYILVATNQDVLLSLASVPVPFIILNKSFSVETADIL